MIIRQNLAGRVPAELFFAFPQSCEHATCREAVDEFLMELYTENHFYGVDDPLIFEQSYGVKVVCALSHPDSLSPDFFSPALWRQSQKLEQLGVRLLKAIQPVPCRQDTLDSLYIVTSSAYDNESPVRSGNTNRVVPSFLLSLDRRLIYDLNSWASRYQNHDGVYIGSGELEIEAYVEMAIPDSELSLMGRKVARDIEEATGFPTYYYLMRCYGRRQGEAERRCPGCNRPWNNTHNHKDIKLPFHWFDFKCHACRLVSYIGDDFGCGPCCESPECEDIYARIGEYGYEA